MHFVGKDEESLINNDMAEDELQKASTREETGCQPHTGEIHFFAYLS